MGDPVEQHAIANVVEQLVVRYPTLSRAHIEEIVGEETARLADAKVREYVPSLIEHAADERLREEAEPFEPEQADPGEPAFEPKDADHLDPLEIEQRDHGQRPEFLFGEIGGSTD